MTQVVGINGFKRSGKGTVADFLSADPNVGVVYQVGFADKVKRLTAQVLGFEGNPRYLIDLMDQFKVTGRTVSIVDAHEFGPYLAKSLPGRQVLQNMGTEARILLGEDLWVDQVLPDAGLTAEAAQRALGYMYPDIDIVAITDLRFENEAQRVKDLGGVIWEVIRPGVESDGHTSEQKLPRHLVDYQITNDSTLDNLKYRVENAIEATLC